MRLTKLKIQAKAKVAALTKQVLEQKGQDEAGSQVNSLKFTFFTPAQVFICYMLSFSTNFCLPPQ